MPLFKIIDNQVHRISAERFEKEKQLQSLVEDNSLSIFGVRFIDTEFSIRGEQAGRIDTLGLDLMVLQPFLSTSVPKTKMS